jgi:hypothetical protein
MSDFCVFCETRRPQGGTEILVLGSGPDMQWLEFCQPCGASEELTNAETGETLTVKQLFDRLDKTGD